jgi:hypothetical protein
MKLPGGENAIVELATLAIYCLSPVHPRGQYKARVFASVLGLTPLDTDLLREELLRAAREDDAIARESDEYGERYTVDFGLARGDRHATVRSTWIVRYSEPVPRLTSCYVLLE